MKRIGVLALQGGYAAHGEKLAELGHAPVEVRKERDLDEVEGLVLPGGESSVQLLLIARFGLDSSLRAFVETGKPVLATCAGLILAAREVVSPAQPSFGFIDVTVVRNAYGRQRYSFEATDDGLAFPLIFIRAPRIARVGAGVTVLAALHGEPILVRQGNVTAATFHPELTGHVELHRQVFGSAARESASLDGDEADQSRRLAHGG